MTPRASFIPAQGNALGSSAHNLISAEGAIHSSSFRKVSDRRLVRPTLPGALLGLEIGTSRATLPLGADRFGRTPHIALSGALLALRAPEFNGWPRRWAGSTARLAPRKNLPDFGASSELVGSYANPAQLHGVTQ
jgi:hypothetical protein